MSIAFDASDDFAQIGDALETVVLARRVTHEAVPNVTAQRGELITLESISSGGTVGRSDAVWHVQLLAGVAQPELGDVLIDTQGNRWTVLEVQEFPLLGRWKCRTRELRVAYGCDDRVDVQRAVWDDLGSGLEIVDWDYVYTALPVRIQPETSTASDTSDMPTLTSRFQIVLGEPFPLEPDDRFVSPEGTVYRIESIQQAERIDVLPVATVIRMDA